MGIVKDAIDTYRCWWCGRRWIIIEEEAEEPENVTMTLERQITNLWESRNLSVIEIKVINVGEDRFQWIVIAEPPVEEPVHPYDIPITHCAGCGAELVEGYCEICDRQYPRKSEKEGK